MQVEILHFRECPTPDTVEQLDREVVKDEGLVAEILLREVRTTRQAQRLRFPGSPTIRVNGNDIEPLGPKTRYGLYCRVYNNDGIMMSWPSKETIRTAILAAAKRRRSHG